MPPSGAGSAPRGGSTQGGRAAMQWASTGVPPDPGQMSGRICMFVLNPLTNDTRVEKEAATLAAAGYDVRIVAALRPGLPATERLAAAEGVRVDEDPLPAKLARTIIGRRRGGDAGQGMVITREAAEEGGLRGRLTRRVLALHLRLVWWKYLRAAYRAARNRPAEVWIAHDLDT